MNKDIKTGKREIGSFILVTIILFIAGLFMFCNQIFYTEQQIDVKKFEDTVLNAYYWDGEQYVPGEDAALYYGGYDGTINEVELMFESRLKEDTTISLYDASNMEEQYLIEQKVVRKGYKSACFYFDDKQLSNVRILFQSKDGNYNIAFPDGTIQVVEKSGNLIQKNREYFLKLGVVFMASVILSLLLYISGRKNKTANNGRISRDSNLELLRIVCMIFLVAHHFAVHGGLLGQSDSLPKTFGLIFLPVGKICFIAFIAISMYFLADGKNSSKRFLKCWLEVLFYSVILTGLTWLFGGCVSWKGFISCFFVMTGNSHGFAASYLLFLLIYPFVLKATKNCTKKQARYLLLFLFMVQIFSKILGTWTGYTQPIASELVLFIFCYILSMNLKRYPVVLLDNKWFDFAVVLLVYLYVYVINVAAYSGNVSETTNFLRGITADESSIFFIISGYALFYLFKNIHIPQSKVINTISASTFGVLLIHDHNFFRHLFWNEVVRTQIHFKSALFAIWFVVIVLIVFGVCAVIDYIRRILLENQIVTTKCFKALVSKLDGVLEDEN